MRDDLQLKLDRCKVKMTYELVFVRHVIGRLRWREVPADSMLFPTMATDGSDLLYCEEYVDAHDEDEIIATLEHEAFHVAGLHPWRMRKLVDQYKHLYDESQLWLLGNIAADAVVNAQVEAMGRTLASGGVPAQAGRSVEEIFRELVDKAEKTPGGCSGVAGEYGDGKQDGRIDSPQGTREQHKQQEQEAKRSARVGADAARRAGQFPQGVDQWLDNLLRSVVPWQEMLARFVDGFNRSDYCWARPSRRFSGSDFVLPSLRQPELAKGVLGLDTSGSIDHRMQTRVASEAMAALQCYSNDPELLVLWFDTRVYPQVLRNGDTLTPKGGGGTRFASVFEYVTKHAPDTKYVVMVTDGECHDFGTQPDGVDVLWVLTWKHPNFEPPFGEVAYIVDGD
jgi:predicted metal-dependent peptidase